MDTRTAPPGVSRRRSALAMGLLTIGTLALALGLFASGASAWEGSCYDYAPYPGAWSEFRIEMADADIDQLAGAGQSFDDGVLHIVLSGATTVGDSPVTVATIASIDFTATPGVAAVYVRAGIATDNIVLYDEPTTAGADLRATDGTTPIEWLTFCYATETQPTSTTTTSTTTTSTTTTTLATTTTTTSTTTTTLATTTTTTAPQNVVEVTTTTTAPTAVLGEQIQRPQPQLALTGINAARLIVAGLLFVAAGLGVMIVNQAAQWRRSS